MGACGGLSPFPREPRGAGSSRARCQQRADLDLLLFLFFLSFFKLLASFLRCLREGMFVRQPAYEQWGILALL